jgi:prepilin-type N-terminal cleavage/methylation domain-containing protein
MKRPGFSLLECLLALALSLFIAVAGFEFFGLARKAFSRLKDREEAAQAAWAAIDKVRIDLLHAGSGLAAESALGLVDAALVAGDALRTTCLESELALAAAASPGATRVFFASTAGIASGQDICLSEGPAGEVRRVVAVERDAVVLESPLEHGYSPASATVSLLERVAYSLDTPARVLRRRVNSASAQPLLDNAAAADWQFDAEAGLVRVRLELGLEGAPAYGTTVFLKNQALSRSSGT